MALPPAADPATQQAEADAGAAAQQQAAQQQKLDLFKKGFGACLEARGYAVK